MLDNNGRDAASSFGTNSGAGNGGARIGTTNGSAGNQAHLFNLVN